MPTNTGIKAILSTVKILGMFQCMAAYLSNEIVRKFFLLARH